MDQAALVDQFAGKCDLDQGLRPWCRSLRRMEASNLPRRRRDARRSRPFRFKSSGLWCVRSARPGLDSTADRDQHKGPRI